MIKWLLLFVVLGIFQPTISDEQPINGNKRCYNQILQTSHTRTSLYGSSCSIEAKSNGQRLNIQKHIRDYERSIRADHEPILESPRSNNRRKVGVFYRSTRHIRDNLQSRARLNNIGSNTGQNIQARRITDDKIIRSRQYETSINNNRKVRLMTGKTWTTGNNEDKKLVQSKTETLPFSRNIDIKRIVDKTGARYITYITDEKYSLRSELKVIQEGENQFTRSSRNVEDVTDIPLESDKLKTIHRIINKKEAQSRLSNTRPARNIREVRTVRSRPDTLQSLQNIIVEKETVSRQVNTQSTRNIDVRAFQSRSDTLRTVRKTVDGREALSRQDAHGAIARRPARNIDDTRDIQLRLNIVRSVRTDTQSAQNIGRGKTIRLRSEQKSMNEREARSTQDNARSATIDDSRDIRSRLNTLQSVRTVIREREILLRQHNTQSAQNINRVGAILSGSVIPQSELKNIGEREALLRQANTRSARNSNDFKVNNRLNTLLSLRTIIEEGEVEARRKNIQSTENVVSHRAIRSPSVTLQSKRELFDEREASSRQDNTRLARNIKNVRTTQTRSGKLPSVQKIVNKRENLSRLDNTRLIRNIDNSRFKQTRLDTVRNVMGDQNAEPRRYNSLSAQNNELVRAIRTVTLQSEQKNMDETETLSRPDRERSARNIDDFRFIRSRLDNLRTVRTVGEREAESKRHNTQRTRDINRIRAILSRSVIRQSELKLLDDSENSLRQDNTRLTRNNRHVRITQSQLDTFLSKRKIIDEREAISRQDNIMQARNIEENKIIQSRPGTVRSSRMIINERETKLRLSRAQLARISKDVRDDLSRSNQKLLSVRNIDDREDQLRQDVTRSTRNVQEVRKIFDQSETARNIIDGTAIRSQPRRTVRSAPTINNKREHESRRQSTQLPQPVEDVIAVQSRSGILRSVRKIIVERESQSRKDNLRLLRNSEVVGYLLSNNYNEPKWYTDEYSRFISNNIPKILHGDRKLFFKLHYLFYLIQGIYVMGLITTLLGNIRGPKEKTRINSWLTTRLLLKMD